LHFICVHLWRCGLQDFLERADSLFSPGHLAEGIVFHHPDGRRAKIKRRDFFRGKRGES
jgi:hypothetical protein